MEARADQQGSLAALFLAQRRRIGAAKRTGGMCAGCTLDNRGEASQMAVVSLTPAPDYAQAASGGSR